MFFGLYRITAPPMPTVNCCPPCRPVSLDASLVGRTVGTRVSSRAPAQNRTCSFPAYGSRLGYLTANRSLGQAFFRMCSTRLPSAERTVDRLSMRPQACEALERAMPDEVVRGIVPD